MKSNAVSAATAKTAVIDGVSGCTIVTESAAGWFNGTGTALDCYLNLAVADDGTHTAGTGTITGTVTLLWVNIGTLD